MQNKRKIEGGFGTEKREGFSGNAYTNIIIIPHVCSHIQVRNDTLFINGTRLNFDAII